MGAVTRRTGIGEHTLRAWERRFGFPAPQRLPSGHRRYPAEQVRQLLLIKDALRCGYRAGDVVPLDRERLEELLAEAGRDRDAAGEPAPEWMRGIFEVILALDGEALAGQLRQAAVALGVGRFLRERVEPMLAAIGEAWARGDLKVHHEHFFSQILEDVLRTIRVPLEASTSGRPVVLATLPEEQHGLGLQMAALAVVAAGRALRLLGPRTPVEEIAEAALAVDAAVVGLSISLYSAAGETAASVVGLRRRLPQRVRLWLGGAGAGILEELPVNVEVLESFDDVDRALCRLAE
jgi:DNA-binding transcriptional MerR regulator/methylmalonyl-CoA mutase cobalamin-binding subunit